MPSSGESTKTERGVKYQLLAVITEAAQLETPSCSQPQPATDNGVRDSRSNWQVAHLYLLYSRYKWFNYKYEHIIKQMCFVWMKIFFFFLALWKVSIKWERCILDIYVIGKFIWSLINQHSMCQMLRVYGVGRKLLKAAHSYYIDCGKWCEWVVSC